MVLGVEATGWGLIRSANLLLKYSTETAKKMGDFQGTHGDKHVPKWNPSAPRKDAVQPGTAHYEDDSDDEATDALAATAAT